MTKKCKECGIIFQTDNPDQDLCVLCEDDRRKEEDTEDEYLKNRYYLRRRYRWLMNQPEGIFKKLFQALYHAMYWVNEHCIKGVFH